MVGKTLVSGEMGKYLCSNFLQPFIENINRGSSNDGSLFKSLRPLPKRLILSSSDVSYLEVPS